MMSENEIVMKYLKVPYLRRGMDPRKGLNCWGLVKAVYRDLKNEIIDIADFAENCSVEELPRFVDLYTSALKETKQPKAFDVVLMSFEGFLHAGVVLSGRKFLHTCKAGTGICSLGNPYWKSKILGYYRAVRT